MYNQRPESQFSYFEKLQRLRPRGHLASAPPPPFLLTGIGPGGSVWVPSTLPRRSPRATSTCGAHNGTTRPYCRLQTSERGGSEGRKKIEPRGHLASAPPPRFLLTGIGPAGSVWVPSTLPRRSPRATPTCGAHNGTTRRAYCRLQIGERGYFYCTVTASLAWSKNAE